MFSFYFSIFLLSFTLIFRVLKGMKGEHVIDDTGNAQDTGGKENGIKLKRY